MILITGGTGFLGEKLIERLCENNQSEIRVLARNEGKLILLKEKFPNLEIITGDISDEFICQKALKNVDKVYHLAAFKHVGIAESQPWQCVNSNLIGTMNLLKHFRGDRFVAISTDKSCQVAGVYGATKYLMERVIDEVARLNSAIEYRVVRYGNVLYSTGSVLVKWKDKLQKGEKIIVTDPRATRFFWTVDQAIDLIFECESRATDASPYVPEMKSISIGDLLTAMHEKYGVKELDTEVIGLQAEENMHEKILEDGPYSNEVESFTIEEIKQMI